MKKIPRLKIDPWPPGLADYMPVCVVEEGGRPFLTNVPLKDAKLIVDVFDLAASLQTRLHSE